MSGDGRIVVVISTSWGVIGVPSAALYTRLVEEQRAEKKEMGWMRSSYFTFMAYSTFGCIGDGETEEQCETK